MEPVGVAKQGCQVHKDHRPSIGSPVGYFIHVHHIHPLGEGGKDTPSNTVRVCPTGHDRIHFLLRTLLKNGGKLPRGYASKFSEGERTYAAKGYAKIVKARKAAGRSLDEELAEFPGHGPAEAVEEAVVEEKVQEFVASDIRLARAERVAAIRKKARIQDALNRALRTVWQFIIVDVILTIIPMVTEALQDDGDPIDWGRLGRTAARVALGGVVAYVMRLRVPPKDTPPEVDAPGDPIEEPEVEEPVEDPEAEGDH